MTDYRTLAFSERTVTSYGKVLGKNYYGKIYASENLIRVVIHSVPCVQVDSNWWARVVDGDIRKEAERIRNDYLSKSPPRIPGSHDIYCTYLSGIERILFKNRGFFEPLIPEIDDIIIGLNRVRLPRNLTGHMNILNSNDRKAITDFYQLCRMVIARLQRRPHFKLHYPS